MATTVTTAKKPGRQQRKKLETRARLMVSAYELMSRSGVDGTSIAEITEHADLGFGTFYNYFKTKDEIAIDVLDAVIDDLGRRNDLATEHLKGRDPGAVQAISIRTVAREMRTNPLWRWWFERPDLLADRLQVGFYKYGVRDLNNGIRKGHYALDEKKVDATWRLQMWMLVAGLKELFRSDDAAEGEVILVETIMRAMGLPADLAEEVTHVPVPELPPARVVFTGSHNTE
jgi:AcrR family transcriptional regulator